MPSNRPPIHLDLRVLQCPEFFFHYGIQCLLAIGVYFCRHRHSIPSLIPRSEATCTITPNTYSTDGDDCVAVLLSPSQDMVIPLLNIYTSLFFSTNVPSRQSTELPPIYTRNSPGSHTVFKSASTNASISVIMANRISFSSPGANLSF